MEEKPIFYYIRGKENNAPAITVCLLKEGGFFFRGVSICSAQDDPMKDAGKIWAYRRILRAKRIHSKNQSKAIQTIFTHKDLINFNSCKMQASMKKFDWNVNQVPFCYKTSIFDSTALNQLTDFEKKLMRIDQ